MFAAVGIYGLATLVFALSRSMVLSAAALAILGAADMVSVFMRQTLVQIVTPDPLRGEPVHRRVQRIGRVRIRRHGPLAWPGRLGDFRRLRRHPCDAHVGGTI